MEGSYSRAIFSLRETFMLISMGTQLIYNSKVLQKGFLCSLHMHACARTHTHACFVSIFLIMCFLNNKHSDMDERRREKWNLGVFLICIS